jgi:hypothetical protein
MKEMSFPIHPDDMPSPRFGGWADDFNTYREACEYYGCDTPEQIEAENEYYAREEYIAWQDDLETRGPRIPEVFVELSDASLWKSSAYDDGIPF